MADGTGRCPFAGGSGARGAHLQADVRWRADRVS